jgi:hypothetical protein
MTSRASAEMLTEEYESRVIQVGALAHRESPLSDFYNNNFHNLAMPGDFAANLQRRFHFLRAAMALPDRAIRLVE